MSLRVLLLGGDEEVGLAAIVSRPRAELTAG